MASFTIKIKGTKKNISKFFSALTHEGDVRMGRGAEADICYLSKREALITGICKDNIHLNSCYIGRGVLCLKIGYEMLIVHLGTLCSTYQFHLLITYS